jgi:hypothetical protein
MAEKVSLMLGEAASKSKQTFYHEGREEHEVRN